MSTLADIKAHADAVSTFTDDTMPAGYFAATAKMDLGYYATYLLLGAEGDDDAKVIGRIQERSVYLGTNLLGGVWIGSVRSFADAYTRITGAYEEVMSDVADQQGA